MSETNDGPGQAPDLYLPAKPGDIIRANDWNQMQVGIRDHIRGHDHTGGAKGERLGGAALREDAALKVAGVEADAVVARSSLRVNGKEVLEEVEALAKRVQSALGGDEKTGRVEIARRWSVGRWSGGEGYSAISGAEDAERAESYALLVGTRAAEPGHTYLNARDTLHLRIGNEERLTVEKDAVTVAGDLTLAGGLLRPDGKRGGGNWQPLPLQAEWKDYDANWEAAAYMRDALGFVHLRGLVAGPGVGTWPTGELKGHIATLPDGFRPRRPVLFPADFTNAHGRIDVMGDGRVIATSANNQMTGQPLLVLAAARGRDPATTHVTLATIRFFARP